MKKIKHSRRRFIKLGAVTGLGVAIAPGTIKSLSEVPVAETFPLSNDEPVIDIHQHLHYVGRSDQQMLDHQLAMGVSHTVLLPAGSLAYNASTLYGKANGLKAGAWGNNACYEFAQKHKNYFFGVCEVPDLPGATKEMEKYLKLGAVIIGELKFAIACDSPEMQAIYQLAEAYDVPVLMHWRYKMFNYGYDRFYKMLEKYPRVKFIGHSQTFWANISGNYTDWSNLYPKGEVLPGGLTVEYLRKYPNLYGDLSAGSGLFALQRDEGFTKEFMSEFQDKLLFGSDCHEQANKEKICYGKGIIAVTRKLISEKEVRRKILYKNAKRLLKLPV